MNRFFQKIAELFRPFHDNGLGEDLRLPDDPYEWVHRGTLLRMARMSVSQGMSFWIFEAIGPAFAKRAVRAWRPREILLMEDLSLAFHEVNSRAQNGITVTPIHIERLEKVLFGYFDYQATPHEPEAVRSMIDQYIKANWRRAIELSDDETDSG